MKTKKALPIIATGLFLSGAIALAACTGGGTPTSSPSGTETASASATPTPMPTPTATCDDQFKQVVIGNGTDGKAVEDFSKRFADLVAAPDGTALSKEDIAKFLAIPASNANLLAYYGHTFGVHESMSDTTGLAENGCLTEKGKALYYKLAGVVETAKAVNGHANPGGLNTGMSQEGPLVAERAGITTDTKAMVYTLKNGMTVTILYYCGNVILETPPPGVPTSPVLPQPPVPPTTVVEQKDPSQDPYPRGNSGNGGGLNADPGPGTYVPPASMERPPSTPYVAPAQPAPQPAPVNNEPAPTPIETPRNVPAPEPGVNPAPAPAPAPGAPAPANTTKPTLPAGF